MRPPEAEFFCECGRLLCSRRIRLTLAEYEAIRAAPGFLTSTGDAPRTPRLLLVETPVLFSDAFAARVSCGER